ncbi:cytohesin-interacting protein [Elgaria multicarinata webbii]|uniref:cytohesin-interacting protein n=1 Tax=Elgaria multicarinata webbii TaxID=159646 RepID=UPI002FCD4E02
MSLKRLIQQNGNANCVGYCVSSAYTPCLDPVSSPPLDNKRTQAPINSLGTLSRDYKQLALSRTSSLGDSSGPQRKSLKILKEDNETFGFEIQVLPFQRQSNNFLETYAYVCKVKEGSPAFLSGLQSGYILTSINGTSTERLCRKEMVDLMKSSGNLLRLVIVNEALIVKRTELETKLRFLKKTLQEKLVEVQSLCLREHHLANGEVDSPLDSVGLDSSNLFGDGVGPGSAIANKPRFSSESSCLSRLSSMTVDSEDSFYQACVFEDLANGAFSRQSSTEDDCFLPRDTAIVKTSLRRHRSISVTSSGSRSPSWDQGNTSNIFGTLPRKSRKSSIRKRLLNFIPGLHRAVEEEESRV